MAERDSVVGDGPRALLPAALVRRGQALLHQQCWCWGCDIRRPEGNLLLARGFSRERPADARDGSSRYTRISPDGAALTLWGFGALLVLPDVGSAFIQRYRFLPSVTTRCLSPAGWRAEDVVTAMGGARAAERDEHSDRWRRVLVRVLDEFFEYEQWVQAHCGPRHRRHSLRAWRDRPVAGPDGMARAWLDLADACNATLGGPRSQRDGAMASASMR